MTVIARFLLGCSFFALLFSSRPVAAEEYVAGANHAIAIEVSTGKILYEKDATTPTSIASITNLLTAYLVYEAMEEGKFMMETPVEISDYPYNLSLTAPVANVAFASRSYTIRQLLQASLISSASSATIALAEKVAGSEEEFVNLMRKKLEEWGIADGLLVNATGLNNQYLGDAIYPGSSATDENKLSATAVAIVARRLLLDYPEVLAITSLQSYEFSGLTYRNANLMLENSTYERAGVDGLKVALSENGAGHFVATSYENNMRVLTVLLGVPDSIDYPEKRFTATNDLFNYVYKYFSLETLVAAADAYNNSKVTVFNGNRSTASAVAATDFYVVRRNKNTEPILASFSPSKTRFDAPLEKGTLAGTLQLEDTDLIGQGYVGEQPSIELFTAKAVPEASWPLSWWNHFVRYVNENL